MKIVKIILVILIFSVTHLAQKTTPKPKTIPKLPETTQTMPEPQENTSTNETKLSTEDAKLMVNILQAQMKVKLCRYAKEDDADCKSGKWQQELVGYYQEAVKHPLVIKQLVGEAIGDYMQARESYNISAPQIAQIALEQNAALQPIIIAQNQRIIDLLEKLANKK